MKRHFKIYKTMRKESENRMLFSILCRTDRKVIVVPSIDTNKLPYLAVNEQALSAKALMKKRKQIYHELDNTTSIVLKELDGI